MEVCTALGAGGGADPGDWQDAGFTGSGSAVLVSPADRLHAAVLRDRLHQAVGEDQLARGGDVHTAPGSAEHDPAGAAFTEYEADASGSGPSVEPVRCADQLAGASECRRA